MSFCEETSGIVTKHWLFSQDIDSTEANIGSSTLFKIYSNFAFVGNLQEHTKLIDMDHGEGDYCSVNVDKVDMFKYPSLQNLPWWSAHLEQGDCMFIPYG